MHDIRQIAGASRPDIAGPLESGGGAVGASYAADPTSMGPAALAFKALPPRACTNVGQL